VQWRSFIRDESVVSDECIDAMQLYIYAHETSKSRLEPPIVTCTHEIPPNTTVNVVQGSDPNIFRITYTNHTTPIRTFDTLTLQACITFETRSTAPRTLNIKRLMHIDSIVINQDKTEITLSIKRIYDDNDSSYFENPCVCEWNTTFRSNEDYGNGWQGDPLAIRQKNKNSDPASIHLEIVCEQSYADTSSLDTLSKEDGIATLHTQQWTHINTIRSAMEKIGTSLLEELTTRYEQGKLDAFKAYTDTIQGRMTQAWENTFGPLVDVPTGNGTDNFNYGGYVLP
jgi:hypothetical protein